MYDIKLGQGCGIKATMSTPAGGIFDLRRARYIAASLVLPSGATMKCEDIAFNEVANGVHVRLLGTRELTTTGQYGIFFKVKLENKTMYSTPVVWFAEVKEDAPTGYRELTISLPLIIIPDAEITAVYAPIEEYESYLHFPTIGKESHLYIDTDAGKTYRWNAEELRYECIGSDYNDIDLIDSGNAWGLKNRE